MRLMKGLPAKQPGEIAMNAPMENAAEEILFGNAAQIQFAFSFAAMPATCLPLKRAIVSSLALGMRETSGAAIVPAP
jgi:hypothetical protein